MATKTYYCGFDGVVKVFDHDTSTWQDRTANLAPYSPKVLNDIMCFPADPLKAITVGQRSGTVYNIFYTTNSGLTWNGAPNPPTVDVLELFEVWVVDSNIVYTCGMSGTQSPLILRSIDGGLTFSSVPLPQGAPDAPATAIHFIDGNIGVVAIGKKVYTTINAGVTWTATNSNSELLVSGQPIGNAGGTYPHAIGGVQLYPLPNGNYRITVLTDRGVVQSVDATNSIYTTTLDYAGLTAINPALAYPALKGTHLTWFGSNYFWVTDNWGGIWYSPTGGVSWGNALSNYGVQSTMIYGAHFYEANNIATEFTGFVLTNNYNPLSGLLQSSIATKNVCDVTVSPNGLQPGTDIDSNFPPNAVVLNAVWTERELIRCFRLKECNGELEVIMKEIPQMSNLQVGDSVNITYSFGNFNSPCLLVTSHQTPICWIVEEIIEDCDIEFPEGQICIEVIP